MITEHGILIYVSRRSPMALPEIITTNGTRCSVETNEIYPDVINGNIGGYKHTFMDIESGYEVLEKNVIKFIPD